MSNGKVSVSEYARRAREKWTNEFDDTWSDEDVARGVLAKYPGDAAHIDVDPRKLFGNRTKGLTTFHANRYGVDPDLVDRLVRTESRGNPKAKSWAGARGLMQLMPGTARRMGVKNVDDPYENVEGGVKYLKQQLDEFKDVPTAVAAYNAGEGAIRKHGYNRVRSFSNLPKTDSRRGTAADPTTGKYVDTILKGYSVTSPKPLPSLSQQPSEPQGPESAQRRLAPALPSIPTVRKQLPQPGPPQVEQPTPQAVAEPFEDAGLRGELGSPADTAAMRRKQQQFSQIDAVTNAAQQEMVRQNQARVQQAQQPQRPRLVEPGTPAAQQRFRQRVEAGTPERPTLGIEQLDPRRLFPRTLSDEEQRAQDAQLAGLAKSRGISYDDVRKQVTDEITAQQTTATPYGPQAVRPDPNIVEQETRRRVSATIADQERQERVAAMPAGRRQLARVKQAAGTLAGTPLTVAGSTLAGVAPLAMQTGIPQALGYERAQDLPQAQLGGALQELAKDNPFFKSNPDLEPEWLSSKVPSAIGQAATMLVGGLAVKAPRVLGVIMGVGMSADQAYQEVLAAGGTEQEAQTAGVLAGILLGPTEAAGLGTASKSVKGTLTRAATKRAAAAQTVKQTIEDALLENAPQEVLQEYGIGKITGQERTGAQLAEAGVFGAIGTAPGSAALAALRTRPGLSKQDIRNIRDQAEINLLSESPSLQRTEQGFEIVGKPRVRISNAEMRRRQQQAAEQGVTLPEVAVAPTEAVETIAPPTEQRAIPDRRAEPRMVEDPAQPSKARIQTRIDNLLEDISAASQENTPLAQARVAEMEQAVEELRAQLETAPDEAVMVPVPERRQLDISPEQRAQMDATYAELEEIQASKKRRAEAEQETIRAQAAAEETATQQQPAPIQEHAANRRARRPDGTFAPGTALPAEGLPTLSRAPIRSPIPDARAIELAPQQPETQTVGAGTISGRAAPTTSELQTALKRLEGFTGAKPKPALTQPASTELTKTLDKRMPGGDRVVEYQTGDNIAFNFRINQKGNAEITEISELDPETGEQILSSERTPIGAAAVLKIKRQLQKLHPEVRSISFTRTGSTGGKSGRVRQIQVAPTAEVGAINLLTGKPVKKPKKGEGGFIDPTATKETEQTASPVKNVTQKRGAKGLTYFNARDSKNRILGELIVDQEGRAVNVEVNPAYRRQGVATQMYAEAERFLGHPVKEGTVQTTEGRALRASPKIAKFTEPPSVRAAKRRLEKERKLQETQKKFPGQGGFLRGGDTQTADLFVDGFNWIQEFYDANGRLPNINEFANEMGSREKYEFVKQRTLGRVFEDLNNELTKQVPPPTPLPKGEAKPAASEAKTKTEPETPTTIEVTTPVGTTNIPVRDLDQQIEGENQLAALQARNASDREYVRILNANERSPLKSNETWKGRASASLAASRQGLDMESQQTVERNVTQELSGEKGELLFDLQKRAMDLVLKAAQENKPFPSFEQFKTAMAKTLPRSMRAENDLRRAYDAVAAEFDPNLIGEVPIPTVPIAPPTRLSIPDDQHDVRNFVRQLNDRGLPFGSNIIRRIHHDPEIQNAALNRIITDGLAKTDNWVKTRQSGEVGDEQLAAGIALLKIYQSQGEIKKADEIASSMAVKLSDAARTLRAAQFIDELSPEGVYLQAKQARLANPYITNKEFSEKEAERLTEAASVFDLAKQKLEELEVKYGALTPEQLTEAKKKQIEAKPKASRLMKRIDRMEANARARLDYRKNRMRLQMAIPGAPPPELIDWATIATAKLLRKAVGYAEFARDMIAEFGTVIRPYTEQLYRIAGQNVLQQRARDKRIADINRVTEGAPEDFSPDQIEILLAVEKEVQRQRVRNWAELRQRATFGYPRKTREAQEPLPPKEGPPKPTHLLRTINALGMTAPPDVVYGASKLIRAIEPAVWMREMEMERDIAVQAKVRAKEFKQPLTSQQSVEKTILRSLYRQSYELFKAAQADIVRQAISQKQPELTPEQVRALILARKNALRVANRARRHLAEAYKNVTLSPSEKRINFLLDAVNVPKAIKASVDLSAPGRQGWILITGAGLKGRYIQKQALIQMVHNAASATAAENAITEARNHPRFDQYERNGGYLTSPASIEHVLITPTFREESFLTPLADKIPLIARSNRAYSGYLDAVRLGYFDLFATELESNKITEESDPQAYKDLVEMINVFTGRGELKSLSNERLQRVANVFFWSPRFMKSRIDAFRYLTGTKRAHPAIKKLAMRTMFKSVGVNLALLGLASLGGAALGITVNWTDPEDPDWLKIRHGDTRYDIWGGLLPFARTALKGGIYLNRRIKNDDLKAGDEFFGIWGDFFRNKEAPVAAALHTLISGKDFKGEKWEDKTNTQILTELLAPMSVEEFIEAYREEGLLGPLKASPSFFGTGVSVYKDRGFSAIKGDAKTAFKHANITPQSIIGQRSGHKAFDDAFQKTVVSMIQLQVDRFVNSERYNKLNAKRKKFELQKLLTDIRERARRKTEATLSREDLRDYRKYKREKERERREGQ